MEKEFTYFGGASATIPALAVRVGFAAVSNATPAAAIVIVWRIGAFLLLESVATDEIVISVC